MSNNINYWTLKIQEGCAVNMHLGVKWLKYKLLQRFQENIAKVKRVGKCKIIIINYEKCTANVWIICNS